MVGVAGEEGLALIVGVWGREDNRHSGRVGSGDGD